MCKKRKKYILVNIFLEIDFVIKLNAIKSRRFDPLFYYFNIFMLIVYFTQT